MRVGMVGLGVMGAPMARRLAAAGFEVVGYNRSAAKAAAIERDLGMRVASSPREVAEETDVVMSMVADDRAVREVAVGDAGILAGLRTGQAWVDFSTISPQLSVELGHATAARGSQRIEAPVSGSVPAVESGTLVILVGGDEAALASVEGVLRHLGRIEKIGGLGQALAFKLALNLSIPVQLLGFAEGLAIAERTGLGRDVAIEPMLGTVLASPMLKYRIPFVQEPPEQPWFTTEMMLKDVDLALAEARRLGVEAPLTLQAGDLLRAAARRGFGQQEVASVVRMVEEMAGLDVAARPERT